MSIEHQQPIINDKNIFIAYKNCPINTDIVVNQLKNILKTTNIKYIKVRRYGENLIALLQFEQNYRCDNATLFEIKSPNGEEAFNPILSLCGSAIIIKAFIMREGEVSEWGEIQVDMLTDTSQATDIINEENKSALQILGEEQERNFVRLLLKIQNKMRGIRIRETYKPKYALPMFNNVPEVMQKWAEINIHKNETCRPIRPKSIIIEGRSRIGKSCWARALGNHNYICGFMDLNPSVYSNRAHYNVIDDVSPHELKHWKELIGAQRDWCTLCKTYRKTLKIHGGIPTIILCNPGEGTSYKAYLDRPENEGLKEWTQANAIFVNLEEPLWN